QARLHGLAHVGLQREHAAREVDGHVEVAVVQAAHGDPGPEAAVLPGRGAVPGHGAYGVHRAVIAPRAPLRTGARRGGWRGPPRGAPPPRWRPSTAPLRTR